MWKLIDMAELTTDTSQPHKTESDDLETFIQQVGIRVRAIRLSAGLSRRALSERAGVSQRTIVLLETGTGNISIGLLYRIAKALGHSIEQFFATRHEPTKELRIGLIGLRGAGKSTLGAQLASALGTKFIELTDEVESRSGMTVQEIIELYGQDGYRRLERQALEAVLVKHHDVVLAAAGGIVANPDSYNILLHRFHTIWLKASPEEHMQRVRAQGDHRPMAGYPEAMEHLRILLAERAPAYEKADAIVDTSGYSPTVSLKSLLETAKLARASIF